MSVVNSIDISDNNMLKISGGSWVLVVRVRLKI